MKKKFHKINSLELQPPLFGLGSLGDLIHPDISETLLMDTEIVIM